MPLLGIRAARFMVDEMQRDLLETEDQHLDGFFDRWKAAGLPEIEEYRGDRIRSRGEMISETGKIGRAIEKRPELLQEEDTGESPILTGVRRIARGAARFQGMIAPNSSRPAPTDASFSATDDVGAPVDFTQTNGANIGFTLIGPGGEGQAGEQPGTSTPAVVDAGPPTQEPVDLEEQYRRLAYDPKGLGRIARALENPGAAMKAWAMPDEAWAAAKAEARKGTFPLYSTESDAFRHAYASYRLTQEVGPHLAKNFGDANEISRSDNPPEEILMDIYNNNTGRVLALDPGNATRPTAEVILEAMRQGNLQLQPFAIKQ